MTPGTPPTVGIMPSAFVVRKRVRDEYLEDEIPAPAAQHLAAFVTRAEAEGRARRLDREFIRTQLPVELDADHTPFDQGWDLATHLPEFAFRDWLLDEGIEPPPPLLQPFDPAVYGTCPKDGSADDRRWAQEEWKSRLREWRIGHEMENWRRWWVEVVQTGALTRGQLERVWAGLTAYQFHEVWEVPVADPAPVPARIVYAVVHHCWGYMDALYFGRNEPLRAYRTRAAAEAECVRLAAENPVNAGTWNGGPYAYVVVELPLSPEG